MRLPAAVAK